jgi:hypothetical protein
MDKQLIMQLLVGGSIIWLAFLIYLYINIGVRDGKKTK